MAKQYQTIYFLGQKAFFDVVGHKGVIDRFDYEILLVINILGAMPAEESFLKLREYWRAQRHNNVQEKVKALRENNYLSKKGARYHLTDKSLLLIAQVERKLKALTVQWTVANPVGRPVKEKD